MMDTKDSGTDAPALSDKQEHSPLPWRVSPHDGTYLLDANGREVCETGSYTTERDVMKADARLIAAAVNSHADLVAALKEARQFVNSHSEDWYITGQELLAKIDAALSAAKGEKE